MAQGIENPVPQLEDNHVLPRSEALTAVETQDRPIEMLALPPERRAMETLVQPVGGLVKTGENAVKWITDMAASYETMPEDIKDALILMQRPFPASGGGTYYLTPPMAMMVVRYCRAKRLEVHADHWWFDPRNCRIGSTVSGLRAEARNNGLNLGAPSCIELKRPWPRYSSRIKGYDGDDFGYRCSIPTGNGNATYDAWFSTSAATSRPDKSGVRELRPGPWTDNPEHMLQTRAQGNALKVALGSGVSEPIDSVD